jgi:hypothetical protein
MKRYILGLFLALMLAFGCSMSADAQTVLTGTQGYSWPAITNTTPTGVYGNTIQFVDLPAASTQTISWLVTGTAPSVCTFRVEGSFNGYAWFQLDKNAPTSDSCLTSGSTAITNQLVNYIRINILTYTPASSTNIALTYVATVTNINLPQANNFLLSVPGMGDDGALGFNLTGTGHAAQFVVASDPTTAMQVADKEYVDAQVSSALTGGAGTALPLTGGTLTGTLQLNADPTTSLQAATKHYVDNSTGLALPLAGGTVTGPIVLPANPTLSLQAATKSYVDTQVAGVVVGSGGLPTTGGTMTGALTLAADPTTSLQAADKHYVDASVATVGASPLAGTLSANSEATTSSNGISLSLTACLSQAYVCSIVAPALYATTESQPWGSRYNPTVGTTTQPIGPTSTSPIGAFEDLRYGAPQWVMNQTAGSPMFQVFNTAANTSFYGGGPASLTLVQSYLSGARDSYIDETGQILQTGLLQSNTPGNRYGDVSTMNCFAPGDCIAHINRPYSTGIIAGQSEGVTSFRGHQGETSTVQQGSLTATPTCGTTGCLFALTQTQGTPGGWASWLPLVDITRGYNTGYVASISANTFTGSSAAGWDTAFGTTPTTGNTTTTAAVDNIYNGQTSNSALNTFPYNGEVIPVASVSGFTTGHVACIFSNSDRKWETANITAVGGSSITVGRLDFPLTSGSTITSGGLCGFGFSMDANNFVPGATNGFGAPTDQTPGSTIRQVWPIVSNASGNVLTVYGQGVRNPGGRAPLSMAGSGGSASVTITSGVATSCTATGGTGYLWGAAGEQAPQLVVTGLSSSSTPPALPVLAVSSVSGGVLGGCVVESPGSGLSGTPAVTVTPYNPYHIFPQAIVMDAQNHGTGAVDGSALTTAPVVGTVTPGDTMELSHYFAFLNLPINLASFQVQATYARNNIVSATGGAFSGFDGETNFINYNSISMYSGTPSGIGTPWVYGNGTSYAPFGHQLHGPHANGVYMDTPPFGGQYGNYIGGLFIGCGNSTQCTAWNAFYPVLTVANATNFYAGQASDSDFYNPVTFTWMRTAGATQFNGYGAPNQFTFSPSGESFLKPLTAPSYSIGSNTVLPAALTGYQGAGTKLPTSTTWSTPSAITAICHDASGTITDSSCPAAPAVNLATGVSGVLPQANGGTGNTTGVAANISAATNTTLTALTGLGIASNGANGINVTGTVAAANPNTVSDGTGTSAQFAWVTFSGSGQTTGTYQAYDPVGGAIVVYTVSGGVCNAANLVAKGTGYVIAPTFTAAAGGTPCTIASSLSAPAIGLDNIGDSITDGSGFYGNTPVPALVSSLTGMYDDNSGAWGQYATQMAVRTGALTSTMTPSGGTFTACSSLPCATPTTVTFTTNYEPINSFGPKAGVPGTCTNGGTSINGFVLYNGSAYTFTPTQTITSTSLSSCTFQATALDYGYVPIIWAGRNDVSYALSMTNAAAAVAAMAANKPSGLPSLVLGVMAANTETTGSANWNTIAAFNTTLATAYTKCTTALLAGCGFLDVQAALIASANPNNVADWYDAHTLKVRPMSYGGAYVLAVLNGSVTNSATSFAVTVQPNGTSVAGVPSANQYWVLDTGANQEELYCTAVSGSGASWTISGCTRNYNGSGAFAHASGVVSNEYDVLHIGPYAQSIIAGQIAQWVSSHLTLAQNTGSEKVSVAAPKTIYVTSLVGIPPTLAASSAYQTAHTMLANAPTWSIILSTTTNNFAWQVPEVDITNDLVIPIYGSVGASFYWGGCRNYVNGGTIVWGCPSGPSSFGGSSVGTASDPFGEFDVAYNSATGYRFSNNSGSCCTYEYLKPYITSGAAATGGVTKLNGSGGIIGVGVDLPAATSVCSGTTNVTCAAFSGTTLTNALMKLTLTGNSSASTGVIATVAFSTTMTVVPKACLPVEVGTSLHALDITSLTTSGFSISAGASMASVTATLYVYCY